LELDNSLEIPTIILLHLNHNIQLLLKKVVHYRYVDLFDGLHPHMFLSELWFNVMCDSIYRDLPCAVTNENGVVEDEAFGIINEFSKSTSYSNFFCSFNII
jgi:hypothetical protein